MNYYITTENVKGKDVKYLCIDVNSDGELISLKVGYVDYFNRLFLFKK